MVTKTIVIDVVEDTNVIMEQLYPYLSPVEEDIWWDAIGSTLVHELQCIINGEMFREYTNSPIDFNNLRCTLTSDTIDWLTNTIAKHAKARLDPFLTEGQYDSWTIAVQEVGPTVVLIIPIPER